MTINYKIEYRHVSAYYGTLQSNMNKAIITISPELSDL